MHYFVLLQLRYHNQYLPNQHSLENQQSIECMGSKYASLQYEKRHTHHNQEHSLSTFETFSQKILVQFLIENISSWQNYLFHLIEINQDANPSYDPTLQQNNFPQENANIISR